MVIEYIFKQLWKHKKPTGSNRKKVVPIVKNVTMQDGNIWQGIVGATKPGATKMQFPYELPVIETEIDLSPGTTKTLIGVAGLFAGGMVASAVIKRYKPS